MAQPPKYSRNYDFEDYQSDNPTSPLPADQVESELNEIKATTDAIINNLGLIQRDDGALGNSSVHIDALSTAVKNLTLLSTVSIEGDFAATTAYAVGDVVVDNGTPYLCFVAHTSGATIDLTKFVAITAPLEVPGNPTDDNKFLRASAGVGVWTTFTAAMVTDVVAALQSVITAADVAAARTALGLTVTGDALATAASAAAARTTLGATTIGGTIFTAADAAAVRTAIASPGTGVANTFTETQTIQSVDAGATEGPLLLIDRNSASPADSDLLGAIEFRGRSDLPSTRTMAKMLAQALDVSDATEDAILAFQSIVAGTLATRGYFGGGLVVGAPTGGDQGAGSINAESVLVNGTEIASGSALVQISEGVINDVAALDITFTPADWRKIVIELDNVVPATDEAALYLRTDSDAGASFDAGAGDYAWTAIQKDGEVAVASDGDDADSEIHLSSITGGIGNAVNRSLSGAIEIRRPSSLTFCVISYDLTMRTNLGAFRKRVGSGWRLAAADVDAVRLVMSIGNITSGIYKVLGLAE